MSTPARSIMCAMPFIRQSGEAAPGYVTEYLRTVFDCRHNLTNKGWGPSVDLSGLNRSFTWKTKSGGTPVTVGPSGIQFSGTAYGSFTDVQHTGLLELRPSYVEVVFRPGSDDADQCVLQGGQKWTPQIWQRSSTTTNGKGFIFSGERGDYHKRAVYDYSAGELVTVGTYRYVSGGVVREPLSYVNGVASTQISAEAGFLGGQSNAVTLGIDNKSYSASTAFTGKVLAIRAYYSGGSTFTEDWLLATAAQNREADVYRYGL